MAIDVASRTATHPSPCPPATTRRWVLPGTGPDRRTKVHQRGDRHEHVDIYRTLVRSLGGAQRGGELAHDHRKAPSFTVKMLSSVPLKMRCKIESEEDIVKTMSPTDLYSGR